MMDELLMGVGWFPVLASFIISFMLGWLWYSPILFGRKWAEGCGVELGGADDMPLLAMISQALGTLALAWLVAVLAAQNALMTTILMFVAIALLIVSNGKYAQKGNGAVLIEAGYVFAMAIVMIVCQALL